MPASKMVVNRVIIAVIWGRVFGWGSSEEAPDVCFSAALPCADLFGYRGAVTEEAVLTDIQNSL